MEALLAELSLRQNRVQKFEMLLKLGHARQEEIEKARMELEIAEAQVNPTVER